MTEQLGRIAVTEAEKLNRKVAVVGVGGMSGSIFRHSIDIADDKIASDTEDEWNRKILALMEKGEVKTLLKECPGYCAWLWPLVRLRWCSGRVSIGLIIDD